MRYSFGSDKTAERALKQAERHIQRGNYSAAADEYRKLLDLAPRDATLLNTIGDMCVRAGRTNEAIDCFKTVAEDYEASGAIQSAIAVYKKIVKLDGVSADLALRLADLFCRQGLIHDARRQYAAAATICSGTGDEARALRIRQKMADIDPENVECRLELAEQYLSAGREREAYQAFIEAGQELQRKHRFEEAAPLFARALEVRGDSKVAIDALAECLARQGQVEEALRTIRDAIVASPGDPDLENVLGKIQMSAGRLDEAEETLSRIAQLDPTRADATLEVARRYVEAGAFTRAVAVVDRALERLLANGQKKKATAVLKEVVSRDPTNVDALERLAAIYQRVGERRNLTATLNSLVGAATRRGKTETAREALRRLVDLEPETANAQEVALFVAPPPGVAEGSTFPEGFESTPALIDWGRAAAEDADAMARTSFVDASDASFPSSDYSMELADEMVRQNPELRAARIKLLEDIVASQPDYVVGRTKLKSLYVEAGMNDKAVASCVALARYFEERGEIERAREHVIEAYDLKPSVDALGTLLAPPVAQPADEILHLDEMISMPEFAKYFDREWRRAVRDSRPVSLLKIEVDDLNGYFETHGLLAGEYSLERVAGALEAQLLRPGDLIASAGGGVFLALLPDTPFAASPIVAKRLRARVAALGIQHSRPGGLFSVSIGAATAIPHSSYSPDALVAAADEALMRARIEGGDRVETAPLVTV